MEHSARILEKYIKQLEFNIEASKKEHEHDLAMIDEVKGEAVKLYKENRELKAVLDKVTDKLKEVEGELEIDGYYYYAKEIQEALKIMKGEKKQ